MEKQTVITNGEARYCYDSCSPQADLWIQHNTNQNPNRFFFFFFLEIEKVILKCMWECEGPRSVRTIWEKKVGGLTPPDFKT